MFISRSPVKPKVPIGLVRTDQGWTLAQVARDGQGVFHPLVCRASAELPRWWRPVQAWSWPCRTRCFTMKP